MISDLYSLFEKQGEFLRFSEIDFACLDSVYASPEQVYGIAIYENEEQLLENWEEAADELAVKVQSRLTGELMPLRWDMYLILLVKQHEIRANTRKKIENDRQYFRKILLSEKDYPFSHKLPLILDIKPSNKFILFDDHHFLEELKQYLSTGTIERIGQGFFEGEYDQEDLYRMLVLPYANRGEEV
ncbi:hypothetical protein COM86_21705 [Priestia megaterium]|uniref:ABC-three component system middle component 1 n=1 Tax=Priestia megaterium TaxID=1404 RepID=UPI000BEC9D17|nr:ABC-three component system middle component 1 [Priestia megaterium]PEB61978.1 hypothetical protein COM86_21705 [Priestia megaterium]